MQHNNASARTDEQSGLDKPNTENSEIDNPKINFPEIDYAESVRQLGVCNSCRYCEGYCATFQALTRYREFDKPTVNHLANLCHNCRGCYYACQYAEPHEFAINIPSLLANIRAENWIHHIKPSWLARAMQQQVWPYVALTFLFMVLFSLVIGVPWMSAEPFYTSIGHSVMVLVFAPLFIIPMASLAIGLKAYWRTIGGARLTVPDLKDAFKSAATLRQLSGGQGQGCNYESEDRFSAKRRWAHQITMYGFLLCFASTSTATLYHYLFGLPAPYSLFSLPKLFVAYLKSRANPKLGWASNTVSDYLFIVLLFLVSTTGLLLYWFGSTMLASTWLIIHLTFVAVFFVSVPYSKMAHGFFRLAALCRESQLKRIDLQN